MAVDIGAHELADHLRGWLVVGLACNKEFIAQLAIDSDPHANVLLHRQKCNQWLHILKELIALVMEMKCGGIGTLVVVHLAADGAYPTCVRVVSMKSSP